MKPRAGKGRRRWVVGLAAFRTLTVLAGGAELIAWSHGNVFVPLALLDGTPAANRWIAWTAWTALAWLAALPLSFLPSPLIDASTPAATQLALLACGGALMAYVDGVHHLAGCSTPGAGLS